MLVIGENINASNKSVGQAIAEKNEEFLADLASSQSAAGADYIDVNAGAGQGSWESPEAAMEWLKCGGKIEIWSWAKQKIKRGGKAERWVPKVEEITLESWGDVNW